MALCVCVCVCLDVKCILTAFETHNLNIFSFWRIRNAHEQKKWKIISNCIQQIHHQPHTHTHTHTHSAYLYHNTVGVDEVQDWCADIHPVDDAGSEC